MYRISWKMNDDNAIYSGDYCLSEEDAIFCVIYLNEMYQDMTHWHEASRPPPLKLKGHSCSYGDITFIACKSPVASPMASPMASPVASPMPSPEILTF